MSSINLFKINKHALPELEEKIGAKTSQCETIQVNPEAYKLTHPAKVTLYIDNGGVSQEVEWSWIGNDFAQLDIENRTSNPRGWLIVKLPTESVFCLSFGISYHDPNKYCDSDFPFKVLQRLNIKDIKNTTRMNPTSNRRRMIDAFIINDSIDFDAGDTIQKVTFQIDTNSQKKRYSKELPFKEKIVIGNSIKLNLRHQTLGCVLDCLLCLEEICNLDKILEVPVLRRVSDTVKIQELDNKLKKSSLDQINLTIPDLQVIGTKNWNLDDITQIQYIYENKTSQQYDSFSIDNLKAFIQQYNIDFEQIFESITVRTTMFEGSQNDHPLSMFLEYINETDKAMFLNGIWFCFNDDYIKFINSEISETETVHESNYDYINKKIKKEYGSTTEANYNKWIAKNSNDPKYWLMDKELIQVDGKDKFELCDLYDPTGGVLIAVKKVENSQSFCYVMDQSITAAKALKNQGTINHKGSTISWKDINKSVIWLILKPNRNKELDKDGERPRIEDLNYFLAKMKIPTWKRELKNLGIKPAIYISYEDKLIKKTNGK